MFFLRVVAIDDIRIMYNGTRRDKEMINMPLGIYASNNFIAVNKVDRISFMCRVFVYVVKIFVGDIRKK